MAAMMVWMMMFRSKKVGEVVILPSFDIRNIIWNDWF